MSKEIEKTNGSAVIEYGKEQIELIKSLVAPKANDLELKFFLNQCQRTGLDPLTRQIYAIHRKSNNEEKMTIQVSIDGFRVIAERSGVYAGQAEPEFTEENGVLKLCKVRVYKWKGDQRYEAAVGVAYWDEYAQTKDEWKNGQKTGKKITTEMWAKMPHTMLAKVAEALALRKAFPQDLSGLYTSDEMNQADVQEPIQEAEVVNTTVKQQAQSQPAEDEAMQQWRQVIDGCKNLDELKALYADNKDVIDSTPAIKALFSERKKQVTKSSK